MSNHGAHKPRIFRLLLAAKTQVVLHNVRRGQRQSSCGRQFFDESGSSLYIEYSVDALYEILLASRGIDSYDCRSGSIAVRPFPPNRAESCPGRGQHAACSVEHNKLLVRQGPVENYVKLQLLMIAQFLKLLIRSDPVENCVKLQLQISVQLFHNISGRIRMDCDAFVASLQLERAALRNNYMKKEARARTNHSQLPCSATAPKERTRMLNTRRALCQRQTSTDSRERMSRTKEHTSMTIKSPCAVASVAH
eukprot:1597226-Pleurochrysis_carterae.AAC.5